MTVQAAIKAMNTIKVGDVKELSKDKLDSDRVILHLVFELSTHEKRTLVTHWQLPAGGWLPAENLWSLEEHRGKTVRELLNEIVESEGWNYVIRDGYVLVRRFHSSP